MDNALSALLSWQFLLFSLGMFAITWFIRTLVEYFIPNADGNKLWEKLLLPSMPGTFGTVVAFFATKYPYPDGLASTSARLMFGAVAGMFSGLVYQVVKGMLKDRLQSINNDYNFNTNTNSNINTNTNANTIIINNKSGVGNKQP